MIGYSQSFFLVLFMYPDDCVDILRNVTNKYIVSGDRRTLPTVNKRRFSVDVVARLAAG